jgi:hypothetical protein
MPQINPDSMQAIQPELTPGEQVLWAGQPSTSVIFHKQDLLLIPFSLLWGGFAIFMGASAIGLVGHQRQGTPDGMFGLFAAAFVLIGQYFIWGRFIYAAWKKQRTHYAVSDRRVIVVQDGWNRQMSSSHIDTLPNIAKETGSGGMGTLRFFPVEPMGSRRSGWDWDGMSISGPPSFVDIEDVESVYRLVASLRDKAFMAKSGV